MKPPAINPKRVRYFPIKDHWRKLKPLFESGGATEIWQRNFADYYDQRQARFRDEGSKPNRRALVLSSPSAYDSCDWRFERRGPGRTPKYFEYACHSACHWVADLGLFVAGFGIPEHQWRIVSSQKHSTVWNGCVKNPVLFDINFSAIGVAPDEAWTLATTKGKVLKPNDLLRPYVFDAAFTRWFKRAPKTFL